MKVFSVLMFLFAAVPVLAEPPPPINPSDITDEQAQAIRYAEQVGAEIYRHDQAAWGSSDIMNARGLMTDPRLDGRITEDDGDAVRILWVGEPDGVPKAYYEMRMQGQTMVENSFETHEDGKPLDSRQIARRAALKTASASNFPRCPTIYNFVTLDSQPGEPEGYNVYMLVALQDWDKIMVGGSVLVRVDPTGTKVLGTEPYSTSCLVLSLSEAKAQIPAGSSLKFMGMSHVLSDTPSPIHVFLSLQHPIPMIVATLSSGILWKVDNGKITPFQRIDPSTMPGPPPGE